MVDSTLPKEYSVALKGLLSLFIVGTHISIYLQSTETFLWLRLSTLLTPLSLVFFFFFSGYGLMMQHRLRTLRTPSATPSELWKGWLPRRIWGLVKPFLFFYVLAVAFLFLGYGVGEMDKAKSWMSIYFSYHWRVGIPGPLAPAWFLGELIVLYTLYYLSFRYIRSRKMAVVVLLLLVSLFLLLAWHADFGYYWLRYPFSFVAGVVYALFEERIYTQVKSHSTLALVALLLLGSVYIWSVKTFSSPRVMLDILEHLAYYPLPVLFVALSKAGGVTDFVMKRMTRGVIIRQLRWIGEISLEVYLLHIIWVNFYRSVVCTIDSPLLYMLAVYTSTIVGAYLIVRYLRRWVRA